MTWIFLYFFLKLEYFWIFDVYSYVGEQVFEDYENGTFSIDGLLEVIFLKQLFTQIVFVCLFFSKGAVTVKFWKSRFSTRASNIRYDRGVFSRWLLPAWNWRRTGRGNIFWWQLSAMLRKIWTKTWQWRNVAPMGNNWPPTTGVAGATMGKALSLPGEWLCYLSKGWLKTERFRQKYIKSGQKVVVTLLFSQAFLLLKALNKSRSLFIFGPQSCLDSKC